MKLETTYRKKEKERNRTNMLRLNNILLKNKWVNDVFKGKSESTSRQRKIETQLSKIYRLKQK